MPTITPLRRIESSEARGAALVNIGHRGSSGLAAEHTFAADDHAIPLVQLYPFMSSRPIRSTLLEASGYAIAIGPCHLDVDPALVTAAHELGLPVHPYTVNSSKEMLRQIRLRVDGIFTDFRIASRVVSVAAAASRTSPASRPRAPER